MIQRINELTTFNVRSSGNLFESMQSMADVADFSASLFLQSAYGDKSNKKYMEFWDYERKTIIERNRFGYRPIDVGPVTMGYLPLAIRVPGGT